MGGRGAAVKGCDRANDPGEAVMQRLVRRVVGDEAFRQRVRYGFPVLLALLGLMPWVLALGYLSPGVLLGLIGVFGLLLLVSPWTLGTAGFRRLPACSDRPLSAPEH